MQNKPFFGAAINRLHPISRNLECRILFNERAGTRITDVCKLNPGTISGAVWTGSKLGGGLTFDGSNDYVDIGKILHGFIDYNKQFTISIWYTLSTLSQFHPCLVGNLYIRGGSNYDTFDIRIYGFSGTLYDYQIWFNSAPTTSTVDGFFYRAAPQSPYAVGKQYCVVFTYDGSNSINGSNIYHNAVLLTKSNTSDLGPITQSIYQAGRLTNQPFLIGSRYNGNTASADLPFNGTIDQLMLHSRVLNKKEIIDLYNDPWLGVGGTRLFAQSASIDWTPHDPAGMLGIHGI